MCRFLPALLAKLYASSYMVYATVPLFLIVYVTIEMSTLVLYVCVHWRVETTTEKQCCVIYVQLTIHLGILITGVFNFNTFLLSKYNRIIELLF